MKYILIRRLGFLIIVAVTYVREVIVNVEGNAILQDFLQGPLFDYSIDMRFAVCYMDFETQNALIYPLLNKNITTWFVQVLQVLPKKKKKNLNKIIHTELHSPQNFYKMPIAKTMILFLQKGIWNLQLIKKLSNLLFLWLCSSRNRTKLPFALFWAN